MNFRIDNSQVLITMAKGDYIKRTFESFSEIKGIGCAWLNGIGALENPKIGYYSIDDKSYHRKHFKGEFELTSLIGNISNKEMHRTFNMGYGFVIVCPKSQHNNVVSILDEYKIKNDVIGEIFSGSGVKVNGKSVL